MNRVPGFFQKNSIAAAPFLALLFVSSAVFAQGLWHCATENAQFSQRQSHQSVVFDNKLWVLNGYYEKVTRFDTWYSSNGTDWTRAAEKTPYPMSAVFAAVANGGHIWVMGGQEGC